MADYRGAKRFQKANLINAGITNQFMRLERKINY